MQEAGSYDLEPDVVFVRKKRRGGLQQLRERECTDALTPKSDGLDVGLGGPEDSQPSANQPGCCSNPKALRRLDDVPGG